MLIPAAHSSCSFHVACEELNQNSFQAAELDVICVNAPRRNKRLPLPLHLAAEITDTCSPSLYISLLLAQIDNINKSFLCALWLCSSHEQHLITSLNTMPTCASPKMRTKENSNSNSNSNRFGPIGSKDLDDLRRPTFLMVTISSSKVTPRRVSDAEMKAFHNHTWEDVISLAY
jgi:hypothetical protein